MPDVELHRKAVYSFGGTVNFNSAAGRQSSICKNGVETESVTVDELCKGRGVTYIKMDVEGNELCAIEGAKNTIINHKPKLSVAAYHRIDDFLTIPEKVLSLRPDYKMYIRHFPYIPAWDTNYYFI